MAREAPDELITLLVRTTKAIVDRLRVEHAGPAMTVVEALAAEHLRIHDDVTAGDLARYLHITKQSASEIVAALEQAGIIRRVPHPSDGRARVLQLTPAGRARLDVGRRRWREVETEWADLVGHDRLDTVREVLDAYLREHAGARAPDRSS